MAITEKRNPYLDLNFKDRTNEVEELKIKVLDSLKTPTNEKSLELFAELISDMFFHWTEGTFETDLMVLFKDVNKTIK